MAVEIQIPKYKEPKSFLPPRNDPTHALTRTGLKPVLSAALSNLIIAEKVSAEGIPEVLDQVFSNQLPNAFRRALKADEARRAYYETADAPILELLSKAGIGSSAVGIEKFRELEIPADTEESLRERFSGRKRLFKYLTNLRSIPTRGTPGEIFELVKDLAELYRSGVKDSGLRAHEMVRAAISNPSFTVPFDKSGSLYFLTHLPTDIRYSIQDMLFANNSIDYLRNKIPDTARADVRQARDTICTILMAKVFSNHHWDVVFTRYSAPGELLVRIGEESQLAEREILKLAKLPGGKQVQAFEREHAMARRMAAGKMFRRFGAEHLQHYDTGHTFPCDNLDLSHAALLRDYGTDRKDGSLAVIFEDDPRQALAYRKMINQMSRLRSPADGSLTTDSAEQVLKMARRRLPIAVYLLDISQPGDDRAGLHLMKELIVELTGRMKPLTNRQGMERKPIVGGRPRYVRIRLWSSSAELLKEAESDVKKFLADHPRVAENVNQNGSGGNQRIEIQFGLKSDRAFIRHI